MSDCPPGCRVNFNIFQLLSVESQGQAVKSQKHIQLGRNLFTARYMQHEIVILKSRQELHRKVFIFYED